MDSAYYKEMYKLLVVCLFFSSFSLTAETLVIEQSDIKYIYDADTFFIHCLKGFKCKKNKLGVRVMGVDSAEIKGRCREEKILARQAKKFAVEKIREAKKIELVINPKKQYGRWGRLLAWVKLDGYDLGDMLIKANLGREYHGRRRRGWCIKNTTKPEKTDKPKEKIKCLKK